jgi:ABC-type polysaccharide/polyol phosphate export permease
VIAKEPTTASPPAVVEVPAPAAAGNRNDRPSGRQQILSVDSQPQSLRRWLADIRAHREVLLMLARADFHVRYKRASFGVLWAVAVPAIQAAALAVVFSHFVRTAGGFSYSAYAIAGVLAWGYLAMTMTNGSTAIVDGSGLTDKVWFPRALLPLVPCLANLPGLLISFAIFLAVLPALGGTFGPHTALLVPAIILMVCFCTSLSLLLAALHVYFRDVKYLVQAGLLVFFYLTPIAYPQRSLGSLGPWLDFNPLTGIANLFHAAAVGHPHLWSFGIGRSVIVSVLTTIALTIAAVEFHRRHDRLFADLL